MIEHQYTVALTSQTVATSIPEAVQIVLDQVRTRDIYVEVSEDGHLAAEGALWEFGTRSPAEVLAELLDASESVLGDTRIHEEARALVVWLEEKNRG